MNYLSRLLKNTKVWAGGVETLALLSFLVVVSPAAADGVDAVVSSCSPSEVRVTTTPSPPQRGWAYDRLAGQKKLLERNWDVVFLGDSLIERWPNELLGELFPEQSVVNLGMGSDRVQNTLWRLQILEFAKISPHAVVILVGTNNLTDEGKPCAIFAGIRNLYEVLIGMWPRLEKVYIIGLPPRGPYFDQFRAGVAETNSYLKEFASTDSRVKFIEPDKNLSCGIVSPSETYPSWLLSLWSPDSTCENYLPDHLHLSPEGYKLLNRSFPTERLEVSIGG